MSRWEYRCETFLDAQGAHSFTPSVVEVVARLNELGVEGWEVCEVASMGAVFLKRPLGDAAQPG